MLVNGFKKNWFYFVAKSLPYMVSGQNFPTHYLSGQGQHAKNHKYLKPSGPLSHLPTLMSSSVKKVCTLIFQFQYDMAARVRIMRHSFVLHWFPQTSPNDVVT